VPEAGGANSTRNEPAAPGAASRLLSRPDGVAPHVVEALEDLAAELRQKEDELREANAKYRALVEQIPAIIYVDAVDDSLTMSHVSPQVERLLGIPPSGCVHDPKLWYEHLHPDDRERTVKAYSEGRESGEPFTIEYRLVTLDGSLAWFRDTAAVVRSEDGSPAFVHGVMLDVTEQKRAEEQVAFIAYHDALTELPNRTMFEELLELALARARRHDTAVAVITMDLDDFKLVNDSLGHEAGDELIRQLAWRLREATRETDLVARQGGDEFLLLLADLDQGSPASVPNGTSGAVLVAESVVTRIQEALQKPFELQGTEVYVTGSIGISVFPEDAEDGTALLRNADAAMYQSKKTAPGGYAVHTKDEGDPLGRLSLTTRLRKAVEHRHWVLHYQPVVDLSSGQMVGVEALLRWADPNGGLVPPGEFIPLAEEMGLIEVIGDWVMEELARQDAEWRDGGLSIRDISFNLSPRQLWQPDVSDRILSRFEAHGVDPARVVVEITESAAMTDPDRTQRILWDLHARGLRLAIDDFGTGYSSLSRLKHMPVDILKVDRSFVRDVASDPQAGSMVRAIIQLADGLGMLPLAEGIETEDEWRFLVGNNCPLGQGYHFSRPIPAQEIVAQHHRSGLAIIEPLAG
jgi:diguanylate cyclase (GGDEF)-like protein/PAS domain S-box-containing protein